MSVTGLQAIPRPRPIPTLSNGDRLDAGEFMRRYAAMPAAIKAELIEGVVYMASPVSVFHGNPHADLLGWLFHYRMMTPGTDLAVDSTVRLDVGNVPQPDAALYTLPAFGGSVQITGEGYIEGAPELVAEVSTSSVSYDLGPKMSAYARNGIREYIVWRTQDEAVDWFVLRDDTYHSLTPHANGILRSEVFPGLWLNVSTTVARDVLRTNAELQLGLQSPEHAQFVADLQARRGA